MQVAQFLRNQSRTKPKNTLICRAQKDLRSLLAQQQAIGKLGSLQHTTKSWHTCFAHIFAAEVEVNG